MKYKDFLIIPASVSPNLVEIKFDGSGRVADALHGLFSSPTLAKERIDLYLTGNLPKRKAKNDQTVSEG